MNDDRLPCQGVLPSRLFQLQHPVSNHHRVISIDGTFLLYAEDPIQIATVKPHKSRPFLCRRFGELAVELINVFVPQKFVRFVYVLDSTKPQFLRQDVPARSQSCAPFVRALAVNMPESSSRQAHAMLSPLA